MLSAIEILDRVCKSVCDVLVDHLLTFKESCHTCFASNISVYFASDNAPLFYSLFSF